MKVKWPRNEFISRVKNQTVVMCVQRSMVVRWIYCEVGQINLELKCAENKFSAICRTKVTAADLQ